MKIEELEIQQKELNIAGKKIVITPLVVGDMPGVLRLLNKMRPAQADGELNLLEIGVEYSEEVKELVAIATRQETAFIEKLTIDQFAELAAAALEVNAVFFRGGSPPSSKISASVWAS